MKFSGPAWSGTVDAFSIELELNTDGTHMSLDRTIIGQAHRKDRQLQHLPVHVVRLFLTRTPSHLPFALLLFS